MDFGDILARWEKDKPTRAPDGPERGKEEEPPEPVGLRQARIRKMRPQASLDLHGLGLDDLDGALDAFIRESRREGLEKVVIVHGKGYHSTWSAARTPAPSVRPVGSTVAPEPRGWPCGWKPNRNLNGSGCRGSGPWPRFPGATLAGEASRWGRACCRPAG